MKGRVKSVNAVYSGRSLTKETPYLKIMCYVTLDDDKEVEAVYTAWQTPKMIDTIKKFLSAFKLNIPVVKLIEIDSAKERANHLSPPDMDVFLEIDEYRTSQGDTEKYNITGIDGVTGYAQKWSKKELESDWTNFDLETQMNDNF